MSLCIPAAAAGAQEVLSLAALAGRACVIDLLGCVHGAAVVFSAYAAGVWEQSNRFACV